MHSPCIHPDETAVAEVFKRRLLDLQKENKRTYKQPIVGHRQLDMYHLFRAVQARGGSRNITQWKEIGRELNLPISVTNAGYTLRTKYESHIQPYEEILNMEFPHIDFADLVPVDTRPDNADYSLGHVSPVPQVNRHLTPIVSSSNSQEALYTTQPHDDPRQCYSVQPSAMGDGPAPAVSGDAPSSSLPTSSNWLVRQSDVRFPDKLPADFSGALDVHTGSGKSSIPNIQFSRTNQLINGITANSFQQFRDFSTEAQGKALQYNSTIGRSSGLKRLQIHNQVFTDDNIVAFLHALPAIEVLELGSLKRLTRMFDSVLFPPTLVSLQLNEVPSHLLTSVLKAVKSRGIHDLSVTIYSTERDQALMDQVLMDQSNTREYLMDNKAISNNTMLARRYEPYIACNYSDTPQVDSPVSPARRQDLQVSNTPEKRMCSNESNLSIDQGPGIPDYPSQPNNLDQMEWLDSINDLNF